jgi:hypothetical protein
MNIPQLIGIVIAWSGVIIFGLKLLDFILSDGAKKWIRRRSEDLWLYLAAGYATSRFLSTLSSPWLQAAMATTVYVHMYYDVTDFHDSNSVAYFAAMMGLGLIVHPFIAKKAIRYLGEATNRRRFFTKLSIAVAVSMTLFAVGEIVLRLNYLPNCYWGVAAEHCRDPAWQYITAPLMGELWAIVIIYFSIVLWIVFSAVGWTFMFCAQHVLFQIATHKDGPVMGLAGIMGLIGGLLQFWAAE